MEHLLILWYQSALSFLKVKCLSVVLMEANVALSSLTHDMTILEWAFLRVKDFSSFFLSEILAY